MTSEEVKKPKLIVFDLDYTLWPFWVDTHVDPPFHMNKGKVFDSRKKEVKYYPEVPQVLELLHSQGYILAVASRTTELEGANQLLELFDWDKFFTYKEIYPGSKTTHFNRFQKYTYLGYSEMLFFDDEERNILDLSQVGVCSILVKQGVNMTLVKKALKLYKEGKCCD